MAYDIYLVRCTVSYYSYTRLYACIILLFIFIILYPIRPKLARATVAGEDGTSIVSENRKAQQASYEWTNGTSDPLWYVFLLTLFSCLPVSTLLILLLYLLPTYFTTSTNYHIVLFNFNLHMTKLSLSY